MVWPFKSKKKCLGYYESEMWLSLEPDDKKAFQIYFFVDDKGRRSIEAIPRVLFNSEVTDFTDEPQPQSIIEI